MPHDLLPGMTLYRNFDKAFNDALARESAERFLPVEISADYDGEAFVLTMEGQGSEAVIRRPYTPELARTHQSENVVRQLSRMGGTPYRVRAVHILYKQNYFIPSSLLSEWRRSLCESFHSAPLPSEPQLHEGSVSPSFGGGRGEASPSIGGECGEAFDLHYHDGDPVMTCRHCLRYAMGWCVRRGGTEGPPQLFLTLENGARFRLHFDCQHCVMQLFLDHE